ncbi:MAG TPA: protease pro-enzyme activation domain-containing protein [Terracidiphilus sp.]
MAFAALLVLLATAVLHAQAPARLTHAIDPAHVQALGHHHPLWANGSNDAGRVPENQEFGHLTLVLARSPEQEQAFTELIADQQNPASSAFHHWLTPAEVGERFGLADADIETLTGWLQAQGLQVDWVSPSRIFIGFSGTAANLEQAFGTEIHNYSVKGEQRFSVATEPVIPQALAPAIKAVRGLYTIKDRPLHQMTEVESTTPEFTTTGGGHYLGPADFDTVYDVPVSLTGAGQTIGIVGESRTDFADFTNFRTRTGATFANPIEIVPPKGTDPGQAFTAPPTGGQSTDNQSEATLDVLRSGSVAPGANLLLVVAGTGGTSDGIWTDAQYLVETSPRPANIMSISFGECESEAGSSTVNSWDTLFQQAASEGISVFVSSGDSGASGCDAAFTTPPTTPAANSPNSICSSSYATCVGGTEFNDVSNPSAYWNSNNGTGLLSALGYIPEGGWNEPGSGASTQVASSGGGVSAYIATPSWQTGTGVPSARAGRYTPDVSFSASCHDGYFGCLAAFGTSSTSNAGCVANSSGAYQFVAFCGTSAAAPGMAGVAALLDQKLSGAQGSLNLQLYQEAASASSTFHDATVASSGVSSCSGNTPSLCNNSIPGPSSLTGGQAGFLLTTGFDEVTGLGSLDVQQFLNSYASGGSPGFAITSMNVSIAPGATSGNTSTITVTPSGGFTGAVTLTAVVTSSPAGAQDRPTLSFGSTGTVNLTGTTAGTATLTISTTAASSGAVERPLHTTLRRYGASGAALACILLLWVPTRRRSWRNMLALALLAVGLAGVQACSNTTTPNPPAKITPTVTVTPSPASVTTAQTLAVNIVVAGGSGSATPTGTASLVSGTYTSQTATLSNGSATITIPASSLATGTDPLNATYSPDTSSSSTYNYASGTNTVVVTTANLPGTTAGTYLITVTGTAGAVTESGSLVLVVQ